MDNNFVSNSITKILDLYNKYKDHPILLDCLNENINNLDKLMDKEYKNNKLIFQKNKDYFIHEFLNDNLNTYYYIKSNDLFIEYDSQDYKIVKEDDILHQILINIDSKLSMLKQEIKDEIIKHLKDNCIKNCLPESNTIQKIINYLSSVIFESKEEAKYFLCLLGDNFLKKDLKSINIYSDKSCNHFLNYVVDAHKDYFNLTESNIIVNFSNDIISPLDNNRILKFKDSISNKYLWKNFIRSDFLNLLAVSIHYSNRYENSENYIMQRSNKKLRLKILYLKDKNYLNIIDDFKLNMEKKEGYKMLKKDMFYLWKEFLEIKNIYDDITDRMSLNILFDENFEEDSKKESFLNFYDKHIEIINSFKFFINEDINFLSQDDELEISELTMLYNEKYSKDIYLGENEILSLFNYYYGDNAILLNKKIILNISSKTWHKKKDLKKALSEKFNNKINKDITFTQAYKVYCKYLNNNKKNVASKKYFEKHIVKMIPSQYIFNSKILKSYWSS
tara:strand:+ start:19471 stop:20985 length:1515 start_codon:yes stop_codon:yes gene_type:complete